MKTLIDFILIHGEAILLGIVGFWIVCGVIVAFTLPSCLKNALEVDSDGNFI